MDGKRQNQLDERSYTLGPVLDHVKLMPQTT
jgi:hypothetical protein